MGSEFSIRSAVHSVVDSVCNGGEAGLRAIKEHPKTTGAVVLLALGTAYANPGLIALSSTQTGVFYDAISPTLLGRAVNFAAGNPSETTYTVGSGISKAAPYASAFAIGSAASAIVGIGASIIIVRELVPAVCNIVKAGGFILGLLLESAGRRWG